VNECSLPISSESGHPVFSLRTYRYRTHKPIILPVVSYGCEIWFLTLGEEHRLEMSENRVLR
jgi:hypothetical protein